MGFIYCNLRVLMAERNLNIQKVKDQTTLSRTTISNLYNNNGAGIQFDTMLQLCELLRCTPGDLFSLVELKTRFDVVNDDFKVETSTDTHVVDEEGNGYEYTSDIHVELNIKCELVYQGEQHEIDIHTLAHLGVDEKKALHFLNYTVGEKLNEKITFEIFNWAPAIDEFHEELSEFLVNWSFEEFYGDYIENADSVDVSHGILQE